MMKKISKIPFALGLAMCVLSAPAFAQSSVSVYGVLDMGLSFDNDGNGGKATRLGSGYVSGSRLGFSGTEDLGGGLRALFVLEMGVNGDTGETRTFQDPSTASAAASGGLNTTGFGRRAHVGLGGSFGTVLLGRDYTPLFWSGAALDPMSFGYYGDLQQFGTLSGTGIERFGRASNGIFYTSPDLGGFTARLMYSFGSESTGVAGQPPEDANKMAAIGGTYRAGPFLVSGAFQQLKLPLVSAGRFTGTGNRNDAIIGASYSTERFTVSTGFARIDQPGPHTTGDDVWLGASYTIGAGKVYGTVQRIRQEAGPTPGDNTATTYALAYMYNLSKRTGLYASYGYVANGETASFALLAGDPVLAPGAVGANPRGTVFGIRHTF